MSIDDVTDLLIQEDPECRGDVKPSESLRVRCIVAVATLLSSAVDFPMHRRMLLTATAASTGHMDVVRLMILRGGVPIGTPDYTVLRCALHSGHVEMAQALLPMAPKVDMDKQVLISAVSGRHLNMIRMVLQHPRLTHVSPTITRCAVIKGDLEMLRLFMSDPRVYSQPLPPELIEKAADLGHAHIVRYLLSVPELDPTRSNNAALRLAAQNGHERVVAVLLTDARVRQSEVPAVIAATDQTITPAVRFCILADPRIRPPPKPRAWNRPEHPMARELAAVSRLRAKCVVFAIVLRHLQRCANTWTRRMMEFGCR